MEILTIDDDLLNLQFNFAQMMLIEVAEVLNFCIATVMVLKNSRGRVSVT
jgi:hypothetical protein